MALRRKVKRRHQRLFRWCCHLSLSVGAILCAPTADVTAQTTTVSLTRAEALRLGAEHSSRITLTRADSAVAAAGVRLARQFENPAFSASYSKSAPQAHFSLDVPFEWPSARHSRVAASESEVAAAAYRRSNERAALELDIDTAYSRAQAWGARSTLSMRIARDADSLLGIARLRRDAGDASDLDVELAVVFAGQSQNTAISDSVSAVGARALLQSIVGLSMDSVQISLSETMDVAVLSATERSTTPALSANTTRNVGTSPSSTFSVAAAERDVEAANYRVLAEQRRRLPAPSLSVGFEAVDPGNGSGLFPTVGFALPLPLFNRNNASIQMARAELERAKVGVVSAKLERAAALSNSIREAQAAQARSARSAQLVSSANRIAALSLIAYREGAAPLSAALEAQRAARETLAQYVDDLANSRIADSVLRFYSLTSVVPPQ